MRFTLTSSAVIVAALATLSCSDTSKTARTAPRAAADVPVLAFDSLFVAAGEVQLRPGQGNELGFVISMAVGPSHAFIADPAQHNVKMFDRRTGELVRTIGRPGLDPGQFVTPAALALARNDRVVVHDIGRNVLSVWDTLGRLGYESLNAGFFTSFMPVPGDTRVITGGFFEEPDSTGRRAQVHEIDYTTGEVRASYILKPKSSDHPWASTYSSPQAALVGDVVVAGAMASSTLWLHNRATGRESEMTVMAPWYKAPEYPEQYRNAGAASSESMQVMEEWSREQHMLAGILPLAHGRFLLEYVTRDRQGGRLQNYIVADTAGNSWISTERTPVRLLGVQDTLAFGIDVDGSRTSLLTFRIAPAVLGR